VKAVTLQRVEKTYPDGTQAVRGIDLDIEPGEFVVLLGPSGCGKTTTLRMIAGLETPSSGRIQLGEGDVTHVRPSQRDVGFVFQFYALYPHLSVRRNVSFPLECSGVGREERRRRVEEVAEHLGIQPLLDRYPRQLSGGDQQRVALARAMVRRPAVWLMDEPLGTLDADLRLAMCEFLRAQQLEQRVTTVYVTHDQEEAMRLADRVVVMSAGRILQADPPARVYDDPASLFVARFVGSPGMNFANGEVRATPRGPVFVPAPGTKNAAGAPAPHPQPPPAQGTHGGAAGCGPGGEEPLPISLPAGLARVRPGPAVLGLRPEFLRLDPRATLRGRVRVDEYLGASRCLHLDTPLGPWIVRCGPDQPEGDEVGLALDPAHLRLFDPTTGARLT